MNKMKKIIGGMALAAMFALPLLSPLVARATESQNKFPTSQGGLAHERLDFYGGKIKRVIKTATGQQLVVGEGFLDAICPFGGVNGKYSLALDSGANASAASVTSTAIQSKLLSPTVYTRSGTTSASAIGIGSGDPCFRFTPPIKFVNGLQGIQNDAGHVTLYEVHCSTGGNPCGF